MLKLIKGIFLVLLISLVNLEPALAQHSHEEENQTHGTEEHAADSHDAEEGFNAGEFVIDHVSDSYDWHITSIGEKHISVPPPTSRNPNWSVTALDSPSRPTCATGV